MAPRPAPRALAWTDVNAMPSRGALLAGVYEVEQLLGTRGRLLVLGARHVTSRTRVAFRVLLPARPGASEPVSPEALLLPAPNEPAPGPALPEELRRETPRLLDHGTLENGLPYAAVEYLPEAVSVWTLEGGPGRRVPPPEALRAARSTLVAVSIGLFVHLAAFIAVLIALTAGARTALAATVSREIGEARVGPAVLAQAAAVNAHMAKRARVRKTL